MSLKFECICTSCVRDKVFIIMIRGRLVQIVDPHGDMPGLWEVVKQDTAGTCQSWERMVHGLQHLTWVRRVYENLKKHLLAVEMRGLTVTEECPCCGLIRCVGALANDETPDEIYS